MKLTRRDLLRFAAGSAAGIMFTPIPWKVLDDTAIWTQNWPWIPEPSRGEATQKLTVCTLCGAGCGVRARCINGMPVSLTGTEHHPTSYGTLCAAGIAAHHLAFHPLRVRSPRKRSYSHGVAETTNVDLDQAIAAVTGAMGSGSVVAVLDRRPGRAVSQLYRKWLGTVPGGLYITPPATENGTLDALRTCVDGSPELGFDFEHASCVVSFGTPLFDNWGTPGRMMHLLGAKRNGGTPTIVQIEHRYSRTAMLADTWMPAFPGTEAALALSFLSVVMKEGPAGTKEKKAALALLGGGDADAGAALLDGCDPGHVSAATGIDAGKIAAIARTMASKTPTIVLGGGDAGAGPSEAALQTAVAALNIALGSLGAPGGIAIRPTPPWEAPENGAGAPSISLTDVPDHSIDILILDAAEDGCLIPWGAVERTLRSDRALVVSLSPFDAGLARRADYIIPSPAPFEQWEEVPTPFDAAQTRFAVAAPLMAAPEGTTTVADVIRRLSLGTGSGIDGAAPMDLIKTRMQSVFDAKRGYVQTGDARLAVKEIASVDALIEQLGNGGVWFDDVPAGQPTLHGTRSTPPSLFHTPDDPGVIDARNGKRSSVLLIPSATKGTAGTGQTSPILSKIFQESTLRPYGAHLFVNPATCEAAGLHDGDPVTAKTAFGSATALLHTDATVMPGVALFPIGPDPEAINLRSSSAGTILGCISERKHTWRMTPATLGRA